jgi:Prokaryotic homologs of the JAB domain
MSLNPWQDYYAEIVAQRWARGLEPDPRLVAAAEGRHVEPGEIETWALRLGIADLQEIASDLWPRLGGGSRSRSSEPATRPATRRPPYYLPSRSDQTSRRSRSDASPELRESGSGFRIQFSGGVCAAIEHEVVSAIWEFDSREVETGGWLYGLYPADDDWVAVIHASGPGQNGSHGRGWTRLSDPSQVEADFSDSLARARPVRVGDWHSHPNDDPTPSDADLRIWGRHSDEAGVLPYVALIAMPGEDVGWMVPQFAGWVIREDENGALVCEPAKVLNG